MSVKIKAQTSTPKYYPSTDEGLTNNKLLSDAGCTVEADESYAVLETNPPTLDVEGQINHEITVVGLEDGSQDSSVVKYEVVFNDYTQDTVPTYIINTQITGEKLLEDSGINIYSPSTVLLGGKSLSENIPTSLQPENGPYELMLKVDDEEIENIQYNTAFAS